jgi:WD40 repeat protein
VNVVVPLPGYSSQSPDAPAGALDAFLTAAAEPGAGGAAGLVRLWDLRSAACARQLCGGHIDRVGHAGVAMSPCGGFVASGSDDRTAAVYDLRSALPVARLAGAADAVTAVAWHPRTPCLAAGSLDGGVRFFVP